MCICKLFQDLKKQQQSQPINVHLLDKKNAMSVKSALPQNLTVIGDLWTVFYDMYKNQSTLKSIFYINTWLMGNNGIKIVGFWISKYSCDNEFLGVIYISS